MCHWRTARTFSSGSPNTAGLEGAPPLRPRRNKIEGYLPYYLKRCLSCSVKSNSNGVAPIESYDYSAITITQTRANFVENAPQICNDNNVFVFDMTPSESTVIQELNFLSAEGRGLRLSRSLSLTPSRHATESPSPHRTRLVAFSRAR